MKRNLPAITLAAATIAGWMMVLYEYQIGWAPVLLLPACAITVVGCANHIIEKESAND